MDRMSDELELWKRIAVCEVPGLRIEGTKSAHDGSDTFDIFYGEDAAQIIIGNSTTYHWHRAAAMLVVDALEAAGLAWLCRSGHDDGATVSLCDFEEHGLFVQKRAKDHGGKEHLALLALLAEIVEAV